MATQAPLTRPAAIEIDETNRTLFITDSGNGVIRRVNPDTGRIETIAGGGATEIFTDSAAIPALDIAFRQPSGLILDASGTLLFISDSVGRRVYELTLPGSDPSSGTLRLLAGPSSADPDNSQLDAPGSLAFHSFSQGSRILFIADGAMQNTTAGTAVGKPRLLVIDFDSFADGVFEVQNIVGTTGLRSIEDICLVVNSQNTAALFIAADVDDGTARGISCFRPEELEGSVGCGSANAPRFEFECFDGNDNDGDGLVDFEDPDCFEPLHSQVLRIEFPSDTTKTGIDAESYAVGIALRAFRKFTIIGDPNDTVDDGCCGGAANPCDRPDATTPDTPAVVIDALSCRSLPSGAGFRLYLANRLFGEVELFELDDAFNATSPVIPVAGNPLASSFDGRSALETRFDRPRAILVDDLDNLYISDAANNRIRRVWVGDR